MSYKRILIKGDYNFEYLLQLIIDMRV